MIKIHILHHTFMIYVILATMCILTGGNQILNGFGLLKVNMFFYVWYHLTFILQVPYKKIDENIYMYIFKWYICFRGRTKYFSICYNPISAGGGKYNISSAGGGLVHTKRRHQKGGECWNLFRWRHLRCMTFGALNKWRIKSSTWSRCAKESW